MKSRRRPSLFWPLLLIGLGLILLLSNLNLLPPGIWGVLWRLWPVLLVLLGLDLLIGRRSRAGALLTLALSIATVAGVLILAYQQGPSAEIGETQRLIQTMRGATSATVELDFGAGQLHVAALPDNSDFLMEGDVTNVRGQQAQVFYEVRDGVGQLRVQNRQTIFSLPNLDEINSDVGWDIGLNAGVPLALDVNSGLGASVLDLAGLTITDLSVEGGLGEMIIIFPAAGQLAATVEAGMGSLILDIPDDFPVRLIASAGIGSLRIPGNLQRNGQVYETRNFTTEGDYLIVEVEAGVGEIVVR